jgi:hypothetical protein
MATPLTKTSTSLSQVFFHLGRYPKMHAIGRLLAFDEEQRVKCDEKTGRHTEIDISASMSESRCVTHPKVHKFKIHQDNPNSRCKSWRKIRL